MSLALRNVGSPRKLVPGLADHVLGMLLED